MLTTAKSCVTPLFRSTVTTVSVESSGDGVGVGIVIGEVGRVTERILTIMASGAVSSDTADQASGDGFEEGKAVSRGITVKASNAVDGLSGK